MTLSNFQKGRIIYTESDFACYAILPIFSMQTIRKFYFNKCNQMRLLGNFSSVSTIFTLSIHLYNSKMHDANREPKVELRLITYAFYFILCKQ